MSKKTNNSNSGKNATKKGESIKLPGKPVSIPLSDQPKPAGRRGVDYELKPPPPPPAKKDE